MRRSSQAWQVPCFDSASATSKTRFAIKRSLSEALSASFGPLERPGGLPRKIWRVNRLIQKLLASASPGSEKGQLYGVTVLLTPVNRLHRGPEAGMRRRTRKAR